MRFLILLIVGFGSWFSVWGGAPEQWGASATEVTGKSKTSTLFKNTYNTSVNDTPEPQELQGAEVEDDIETSEGYAAEPNTMEPEDGDDGASDIAMEEDDLAQANPGLNLGQEKTAGKGPSPAKSEAEAQDQDQADDESDDSASDMTEESLDAPDDAEDTGSEEA